MDRWLHVLLLSAVASAGVLASPGARAADPLGAPGETPQVVEPQVERRDVKPADIDTGNFEADAFVGAISIEDFGSSAVYVLDADGRRIQPATRRHARGLALALLPTDVVIFRALACDYDGTLATHDTVGPEARAALSRAQEAGLRLILVTGRTFFELTRVCEPLGMFDAVVAENGGVLYYPAAGMLRDMAPPPPRRFLAELDRRGIFYQRGRVIVAAARQDERAVTAVMADLGVRFDIIHNRAGLMLLPAGVSKGAGVRQALRTLGLSFHDVLALGDAENDIDLFEASGWRACPSNAVPELAARADWVFPGDNGRAVAAAITGPIVSGTLPVTRSARHRVPLGWAVETFDPVTIPERDVNVLVQGDPLSGKSWLTGALVERVVNRHYAVLVLDPEGDYHALAGLPSATRVDMDHPRAIEGAIAHFEHDPAACVVVDLSRAAHPDKLAQIELALMGVRSLRRRTGLPHWVILDEAHYSLHREGVGEDVLAMDAKGFYLVTYKEMRPA